MKNIVLIGSNSIIARTFISDYSSEHNIISISRKSESSFSSSSHLQYDLSRELSPNLFNDLCVKLQALLVDERIPIFILFAWSGTPRTSMDPVKCGEIASANSTILCNFIHLSKIFVTRQVIFLSSAGGLYDSASDLSHDEFSVPSPSTPYGHQKLKAEFLLSRAMKKINASLCVLRISNAYGFNPSFPDQGVLNRWLFDGLTAGEIKLYNSFSSQLNFISYSQVSNGLQLAICCALDGIFNLGSNNSTSLLSIYAAICDLIPHLKVRHISEQNRFLNINCSKYVDATGCEFPSSIISDSLDIYRNIINMIYLQNTK